MYKRVNYLGFKIMVAERILHIQYTILLRKGLRLGEGLGIGTALMLYP